MCDKDLKIGSTKDLDWHPDKGVGEISQFKIIRKHIFRAS